MPRSPRPARRGLAAFLVPVLFALAASAACETPAGKAAPSEPSAPSVRSREVGAHARSAYSEALVATLADLIAFRTVNAEGTEAAANPQVRAMSAYLKAKAGELGFDFADHGAVVVIGLGDAADRLGLITHGDVQPADPAKWKRDPFRLDAESEPGRLVGRGVEDDKGPIAAALYAMKAVKDRGLPLARRIELVVSYTEESDWVPFRAFLAAHPPPALNVGLDADYPVVVAEKGWGSIHLSLPASPAIAGEAPGPRLVALTGGSFLSQIPEDAEAIVASPTPELEAGLRAAASKDPEVRFTFEPAKDRLAIRARGVSAHSSTPWDGKNAITHLAALLARFPWPDTPAARMARLIDDLVGTGDNAEKFGEVAHSHPFMGPLTLALTTLKEKDGKLVAGINLRRPAGRTKEEVDRSIRAAVDAWKARTGTAGLETATDLYPPYYLEDAPHIPVLLGIFRAYTGRRDARPVSIGGGSLAQLLPTGVEFGPGMPGEVYTGHSEHEFMTRDQMLLNLEMYTAMLVELAGR
jgi:dipeptidase D